MKALNLRDPIYILIILCLGFFLMWQCEATKNKDLELLAAVTKHDVEMSVKRTEIRTLEDSISTITAKAKERASKDSTVISQNKQQIKRLAKREAILRVPVEQLADTIHPLRDYLVLADSLSAAKDSLILDMGLRHEAQLLDLNHIINLQAQQIVSEKAVSELLEQRVAFLEKEVKKGQRGKRVWRFVAGVGVAAAAVLLLSPK